MRLHFSVKQNLLSKQGEFNAIWATHSLAPSASLLFPTSPEPSSPEPEYPEFSFASTVCKYYARKNRRQSSGSWSNPFAGTEKDTYFSMGMSSHIRPNRQQSFDALLIDTRNISRIARKVSSWVL